MKNVAATRGHSVRRIDFFREATAGLANDCEMSAGAVAVANFDGFLLKRLTLTTASPLCLLSVSYRRRRLARGSRVGQRFPGISAKLVRSHEITGIFHRCKNFLVNSRALRVVR